MKKFFKIREELLNKEKEKLDVTDEYLELVENQFNIDHPTVQHIKTKIRKAKKKILAKKKFLETYDNSYFDIDKNLIENLEELFYIKNNIIEDLGNINALKNQEWFKKKINDDKDSKEKLLMAFSSMDFETKKEFIEKIYKLGTDQGDPDDIVKMVKLAYSNYVDMKLELELQEERITKKEKKFNRTVNKMFNQYLKKQRKYSYLGDVTDKNKRKKANDDIEEVKSFKKSKSLKKDKKNFLEESKKIRITGPIKEETRYFESNYEPKAFVFPKQKYNYIDQHGNKYFPYIGNIPLQYNELERLKKEDQRTYDKLYYSNRFDLNRTSVPFVVNRKNEHIFYIRIMTNQSKTSGELNTQSYDQLITIYSPGNKLTLVDSNNTETKAKVREFHIKKNRKVGTIIITKE